MSLKAYKGFDKDMRCRGFQYKEGETYETDKAEICECGFHACENPLDCLQYYVPNKSVYHEVELDGEIDRQHDGDTKVAATKIKIGARLSIAGIVKAAIDFIFNKSKPTAGDSSHAVTAGYSSNAATAGEYSNAEVRGEESIAAVLGKNCKARGAVRCWLVLTERDDNWHILGVKAFRIDGKKYKPDTWYVLKNGKVVEAEEGGAA